MSSACSQIDGQRVTALFEMLQCPHVGIGKIVHMNVVADAGAIRSRIVGSIDLQLGDLQFGDLQLNSIPGGGGESERNQVRFGIVKLANLAAFIGSGSVEIAQPHRAESIGAVVSLERIFEKKLRRAIGIYRLARGLLGYRNLDRNFDRKSDRNLLDWNLLGDAVYGTGGGKHEVPDTGVQRGVQEAERASDIA